MLKELRLRNYRAFRNFTVMFGESAYLVGPNNAGKSTILTALRVAEVLTRVAKSRRPTLLSADNGNRYAAHPVVLTDFPALRESVHHEFHDNEARLEVSWKNGAKLTAVWPERYNDEDASPFFYVESKPGMLIREPARARRDLPDLGIVPILGPIEHSEPLLAEQYVRRNVATRLASRHFRNQLALLERPTLDEFFEFSKEWAGDLELVEVNRRLSDEGTVLDVFYSEALSRVPKELVWAGDGLQVWLQLLFHIFRLRDCQTIILDEPEVYLHPDLQRRLVRLLDSQTKQVVLATHSAEVIAEVDPKNVIMVDKTRSRGRRSKDESALQWMSTSLGTAFNLRLARTLRSKVAVFVEGKDLVILRRFARTMGFDAIENEVGITILSLEGYSRRIHVEPFVWLCQKLLPDAIRTFVVLDRDYRSNATLNAVEGEFEARGISIHIWRRKELESYLLNTSVISRLSGLPLNEVDGIVDRITADMEDEVFGRMLDERIREQTSGSRHAVTITTTFKKEFDKKWHDPTFRLHSCPPKQVISALNSQLQTLGLKAVSARSLAGAHRRADIDSEMASLLATIERLRITD